MTNSKEATSYSLSNDINLIELDFQVTSDNILVCRHDWSSSTSSVLETTFSNSELIPTYSEFKDCKIYRKYFAIGINDVFDLMKENKDMYVITDTKNTDLETVKLEFGLLVDAARKSNNEELLNRFVVQLYNFDMLDAIDMGVYDIYTDFILPEDLILIVENMPNE